MSKGRSPAFQHYPDRLLSHTVNLSILADCVFRRLLDHMWIHSEDYCSVPDDPAAIAYAARVTVDEAKQALAEIQNPIHPLLKVENGLLVCAGLRKIRERQIRLSENRSKAGKKGRDKQLRANASTLDNGLPAKSGQMPKSDGQLPGKNGHLVGVGVLSTEYSFSLIEKAVNLWPNPSGRPDAMRIVAEHCDTGGCDPAEILAGTEQIAQAVRDAGKVANAFTPSAKTFFADQQWRMKPEAFCSRYDSKNGDREREKELHAKTNKELGF